jgi:hypothetical protein
MGDSMSGRLNWDSDIPDYLPRHPNEPSIASNEGFHGVALPETVQASMIMTAKSAIELGAQLISLGETVEQIEDNTREQIRQEPRRQS